MGYGMRYSVLLLVNADQRFNLVVDHYRAFDLEPGPSSSMDLVVDVPAQNGRFSTFLELIQRLTSFAPDTALVVNHGMSDQNDSPLGLLLPLTAGSAWNPEEYTLGLLAGFIDQNPSDDDYANAEKGSSMTNAQNQTIRMPPGTLKPIDTALRALRAKKALKRLELRACNLGGNTNAMKLLGKVLGVSAIVAPKVHMFYLRLSNPGPLPDTKPAFDDWVRRHPRSRTFTDPASSNRVNIQVNGQHAFRTCDFDSDSLDVKWFVEKYVCNGSGYVSRTPARGARITSFSFAGMDFKSSFVLAQEDPYEDQLVEVAV